MLVQLLKSKIHNAKITETQLEYEGSITIDEEIVSRSNALVPGQEPVPIVLDVFNYENPAFVASEVHPKREYRVWPDIRRAHTGFMGQDFQISAPCQVWQFPPFQFYPGFRCGQTGSSAPKVPPIYTRTTATCES